MSEDSGGRPDTNRRRISWYRSPLSRDTLIALNRRSDLLGFLQTAGCLALLVGTGGVAVWSVGRLAWPAVVLLFLVHSTCSSSLVNGFHELIHDSVFRTRWLNRAFLYAQHIGLLDNVSDIWLSTRTIILMNFPIEHHKYAAVPCYRLGTLHRLIRHDLPPSPRGLLAAPAMTGRLL